MIFSESDIRSPTAATGEQIKNPARTWLNRLPPGFALLTQKGTPPFS